jgi:anti-sigma factor RsiW
MKWISRQRRDDHPSPSSLLLAIEGELPAKEELRVNQHLQQCWECRAKSEEMRGGIVDYMGYRDRLMKDMDPPPNGWSGFQLRLRNVEAKCRAQANKVTFASRTASLIGVRRPIFRYAGGLAVAMAALVMAYFAGAPWVHPPVVSASEILRRTAQARRAELGRERRASIHQRLLIRYGGRSVTRELVRGLDRVSELAARGSPDEAGLRRVFDENGLSWMDPLDPEGFLRWRNSLASREDRIQTAGPQVTVTTTGSGSSSIREASLTVRLADWHPVEEQLCLVDESRIEITELQPETRGSDLATGKPPASIAPRLDEPDRDATALAQTEMQVRATLHRVGADLGEQIEIGRDASGAVLVKGLFNTSERKRQIALALQGIQNVRTAFRSISEVPLAPPEPSSAVPQEASYPYPPVFLVRLTHDFPDGGDRQRFVDRTLAASQAALMRAWALRRLEPVTK